MSKAIYVTAMMLLFASSMFAQTGSVGINNDGSTPAASAMLDVSSTAKGFLPPRMTTAQRNAISSPVEGLVVFNTDDKALNIFNGTSWGLLNPVVCGQSFNDPRDGKVYPTVQIGDQCWMAKNLNIGAKITGITEQSNNGVIEKYCYGDDDANCNTYGGLYQWAEMVQYLNGATNTATWSPVPTGNVHGLCPTGWHIPSDAEWTTLTTYLGGESVAGGKLKEAGTTHWQTPNEGATNESGFTALPAGYRYNDGTFSNIGNFGYWWSSTENYTSSAWRRNVIYSYGIVYRIGSSKSYGFSVRCLRDF
jgi:uncharacterized protein (TIGR02145 family)